MRYALVTSSVFETVICNWSCGESLMQFRVLPGVQNMHRWCKYTGIAQLAERQSPKLGQNQKFFVRDRCLLPVQKRRVDQPGLLGPPAKRDDH